MKKTSIMAIAASVTVLFNSISPAQTPATLTDLLGTVPTPGPYDIALLDQSTPGEPTGLNYYIDNNSPPGQIFLTGTDPNGYNLNSLTVFAGGSGGGGVTSAQFYYLRIYSYNPANSNATLVATYKSQSTFTFYEGDWLQWSGLSVGLSANTYYAFSFQRGVQGWELLGADAGNVYTNGQAVLIPTAGGQLTTNDFSTTAGWSANMDIGLSLATFSVNDPTIAPGNLVSTGQVATVTSGTVFGAASYTYQWQTDGGSGGALTNIPGATSSSVTANTDNVGVYQYNVVVSNTLSQVITGAVASLTVTYPTAAATLTDAGSAIVPGSYDISQLVGGGSGDGLNYYDNNSDCPGQTFTTGTNSQGYTLTSLAMQTGGNGTSSLITTAQPYYLYIYSVNGSNNATLIQEYTNASFSFSTFGDWLQWSGLNVQLKPNQVYAYAFENFSGVNGQTYNYGWAMMNNSTNNTYAGGQLCLILPQGGSLYLGNSTTNVPANTNNVPPGQPYPASAVFDAGLTPNGVVINHPQVSSIAVSPAGGVILGGHATLSESASGAAPLQYQWLTDGGTGGSFASISGNNASNLVLNTTGYTPGAYSYKVIVSNSFGSATSAVVLVPIMLASTSNNAVLTDIGVGAPTLGAYDIYQTNGLVGGSADVPPGLNYYVNNAQPPGETFTTGNNPNGYVLNSAAIQLGTDDAYSVWPVGGQPYMLNIYNIYNTQGGKYAQLNQAITSQTNFMLTLGASEGHWLQWTGLAVHLQPNTAYAYSFGNVPAGAGYINLVGASNTPAYYAGGQVALLPTTSGTVNYSSASGWNGTFDLGLALGTAPPTLSIKNIGGGQLKLQWTGSTLLQATSVNGPWTTNLATSPYTFTPTGPQMFYRASQ